MDNESLASELLHELKATSKRWFMAFIIVVVLWFTTIGIFIWYVSLPTDSVVIEQESENASYNGIIGGDYNGSPTESGLQEESD